MQESMLLTVYFCIDDTKDSDATNTHDKEDAQQPAKTPASMKNPVYTGAQLKKAIADMLAVKSRAELEKVWYANPAMQNDKEFVNACMEMGKIYPAS